VKSEVEAKVEQALVRGIKRVGGRALKFVSPGWQGAPDRLLLMPIQPEHREVVGRYVKFAECKSTVGRLSPLQKLRRRELEAMGYKVLLVNDSEAINEIAG
jgi:hypothetical protein